MGALGHFEADAAHAEDSEGAAEDVGAEVVERVPGLPFAGIDGLGAFDEAAGGGHEEGEGHVCGGAGENVRGVSDRDAAAGRFGHVNVFETHGDLADGAQVGGGVHELGVYLVGKEAEEAVYVGDLLQEGLARRGEFVGPEFHVGLGGDHVDGLLEDAAGDEDFGFGHSGSWAEISGHYILRSGQRVCWG